MTAQTHKQFAISWAYLGGILIYTLRASNINYYLVLILLLSIAKIGALFPDVDHVWKNVKEKTTINWLINKFIHLTGGKHRSWQTHSWDICIISILACYFLNNYLYSKDIISNINFEIVSIITTGFNLGWASHLFSDMLTSEGVRLICFINYKVALVPRFANRLKLILVASLFIATGIITIIVGVIFGVLLVAIGLTILYMAIKLGNIKFNTGNEWEAFVYKFAKTANIILGLTALLYPKLITLDLYGYANQFIININK